MFKKLLKKIIKFKIYIFVFIIFIFVIFVTLIILINSEFFIKKTFNKSFKYRITGDCHSFTEYLYEDLKEDFLVKCEKEKFFDNAPVRYFEIQNISNKFGSDRAFLQVQINRNYKDNKDFTYSTNYEMKKEGLKWKINFHSKKRY